MGLALVLCLVGSVYFADVITRPLLVLSGQVRQLAESNFSHFPKPLMVTTRDEVGVLAGHIGQMARQIELHLAELNASAGLLAGQNQTLQALNGKLSESEQQLKALNEVKDRFFAIISHDLRGPLANILNFLRIQGQDQEAFSKAELEELSGMAGSVERILALLDNLLAWARSQADHIQYQPKVLNAQQLVTQNLELLAPRLRKKHPSA